MNGVRSTYMRKGYLPTALAAAVLLAASSGTAWAQQLEDVTVTLSAPERVGEGGDITVTVKGEATVNPTPGTGDTASDREVTVNLMLAAGIGTATVSTAGEFGQAGQVNDAGIVSSPRVTLVFAENTGTEDRDRTVTGSITVRSNDDADAEHEVVMVQLDTPNGGLAAGNAAGTTTEPTPVSFTILDNETQTYVLSLDPVEHSSASPPKEGEPVSVNIDAKPPHYQLNNTLTLQLFQDGGRASGYSVMGDVQGTSTRSSVYIGSRGGSPAVPAHNRSAISITTPPNDEDRATDTITLEAHSGDAGRDSLADSIDVDVLDVHMLPAASDVTAVAKDEDGNEVTEIMEGGDPVFLTITVDRGRGVLDQITDEDLTVDIRAADAGQVADYDLSESRISLESRSSGKQSNDIDLEIELAARSDEDVGMEYLMLNLEVSGDSDFGTETSTGTFSIGIVDNTMKKVEPRSEADAYPAILDALEAGSGDDGDFNPGESFTVMAEDLFDVADGYTASYGISVDGGSVSVSASSDSITVTGTAAGESKVTITATAKMAASSFLPEQTMSDMAKITFAVMVVEGMPEPVPALPLFGQLLLALFMTAGGARLYRRRQG